MLRVVLALISLVLSAVILWRIQVCACKSSESYIYGAPSACNQMTYGCYQNCHQAKDPLGCPRQCNALRNLCYLGAGIGP